MIVDPSRHSQQVLPPVPNSQTKVAGGKRPADLKEKPSVSSPCKVPKLDPEKSKTELSSGLNYNDETSACVVCGLSLKVFRNDATKELIHYLSHGFTVLKEFNILKPDDSLFLMCNICTSGVYPKKCQKTFRNHLVEEHSEN